MGKLNNGVFLKIVGDHQARPQWEQFLTEGTDRNPESGLARFIESYESKLTEVKTDLQQLADLEVIILQARSLSNLIGNVKLYTVKDKYIYARAEFYRPDININEVRVLMDPIDLHFPSGETDLGILFGNQDFMKRVYDKVSDTMMNTLRENVDNFLKIYSK